MEITTVALLGPFFNQSSLRDDDDLQSVPPPNLYRRRLRTNAVTAPAATTAPAPTRAINPIGGPSSGSGAAGGGGGGADAGVGSGAAWEWGWPSGAPAWA